MSPEVVKFCERFAGSVEAAETKLRKAADIDLTYFLGDGRQAELLYFSAVSFKHTPSAILEIGSGVGVTTRILANLWPTATIETIDIPQSHPKYKTTPRSIEEDAFLHNVDRPNITLHQQLSIDFASYNKYRQWGLIYVDGDHRNPTLGEDIQFAYDCVSPGGLVFMHDYGKKDTDVRAVVDRLALEISETIEFLPFHWSGNKHLQARMAWLRKNHV